MEQHRHIGYHNYNKNHQNNNGNNFSPAQNYNNSNNDISNSIIRKEKMNRLINNIEHSIHFFKTTYPALNTSFSYNNDTIDNCNNRENEELKKTNYLLKEQIYELEMKKENLSRETENKINFLIKKNKELKNLNYKLKQEYYHSNHFERLYKNKNKLILKINKIKLHLSEFISEINSLSNHTSHSNKNTYNNFIKLNYKESSKNEDNYNLNEDDDINFTEGDNLYTSTDENEPSNQIQISLKQFEVPMKGTPILSKNNIEKTFSSNMNNKENYNNNQNNNNVANRKNIKTGLINLSKIGPKFIQSLGLNKNMNYNQNKSNNRNNRSNGKISKKNFK